MRDGPSAQRGNRGITVLTLLLLIIAVVVAAFFLVRYLRTRPAPVQSSQAYLMSRLIS